MKNIFAFNKDDESLDVDEYITRKIENINEEETIKEGEVSEDK